MIDIKGIIFDMDNTLLQSRIHFFAMKEAIYDLLLKENIIQPFNWEDYTPSQIIEMGRKNHRIKQIEDDIWETVRAFEKDGMKDARLEPCAVEILQYISQEGFTIAILTNNSYDAAMDALVKTNIAHYFHQVAGREQMEALKPSPSGIHVILNHYPHINRNDWLFVGDSWIDGKAAELAGIPFLAYRSNKKEMKRRGISPLAFISSLKEIISYL